MDCQYGSALFARIQVESTKHDNFDTFCPSFSKNRPLVCLNVYDRTSNMYPNLPHVTFTNELRNTSKLNQFLYTINMQSTKHATLNTFCNRIQDVAIPGGKSICFVIWATGIAESICNTRSQSASVHGAAVVFQSTYILVWTWIISVVT